MQNHPTSDDHKFRFPVIVLSILPVVAVIGALAWLSTAHNFLNDQARYASYREFWGGNPSEVYSHWLDMLLMSGNASALAWLLCVEAFVRRNQSHDQGLIRLTYGCAAASVWLSGAIALMLDSSHGEGTVFLANPVFFLPILVSSYYLLRLSAARMGWKPSAVLSLALAYAALHVAAQLYYEPSDSGGPNFRIFPIWVASVGTASVCALVQGVRRGWLRAALLRAGQILRRPAFWIGTIALVLVIGIPVTFHAMKLRAAREHVAIPWLKELESKLTDSAVVEIKQTVAAMNVGDHSRISIPPEARILLNDSRVKDGNSIRIFIPLNESRYIFLWANDRFEYCDVRRLGSQMDQSFIDAVITRGRTHQTALYSILWSSYMAGTVLKDGTGKVKAICIVNAPEP